MLALPQLSVVIPLHRSSPSLADVMRETAMALRHAEAIEFVIVDCRSMGEPAARNERFDMFLGGQANVRWYRPEEIGGADTYVAQAAEVCRWEWVITLDPQGHHDPYDLPEMLCEARQHGAALVEGVPGWRRRMAAGRHGIHRGPYVVSRQALLCVPRVDCLHRHLPLLVRRAGGCVKRYRVHSRRRAERPRPLLRRLHDALAIPRDWLGVNWLSIRWRPRRPLAHRHADHRSFGRRAPAR